MYDYSKAVVKQILDYFNFDEDLEIDASDVRSILDKIADFYEKVISTGVNIKQFKDSAINMKKQADEIAKATNKLQFEYETKSSIELLLIFSNNPIKILIPFLELLNQVSNDCDRVIQEKTNEKEQLTRSGKWENGVDHRFDMNINKFASIYNNWEV